MGFHSGSISYKGIQTNKQRLKMPSKKIYRRTQACTLHTKTKRKWRRQKQFKIHARIPPIGEMVQVSIIYGDTLSKLGRLCVEGREYVWYCNVRAHALSRNNEQQLFSYSSFQSTNLCTFRNPDYCMIICPIVPHSKFSHKYNAILLKLHLLTFQKIYFLCFGVHYFIILVSPNFFQNIPTLVMTTLLISFAKTVLLL